MAIVLCFCAFVLPYLWLAFNGPFETINYIYTTYARGSQKGLYCVCSGRSFILVLGIVESRIKAVSKGDFMRETTPAKRYPHCA